MLRGKRRILEQFQLCTGGGTRTLKSVRTADFESAAFAIPPLRLTYDFARLGLCRASFFGERCHSATKFPRFPPREEENLAHGRREVNRDAGQVRDGATLPRPSGITGRGARMVLASRQLGWLFTQPSCRCPA